MKVLVVDADSKIPNIALMKLAFYHKNQGHDVDILRLRIPYYPGRKKHICRIPSWRYDKTYCSVLFSSSLDWIDGKNIEFGGTGFDLHKNLPIEIENSLLDYSIYPNNEISYGFISRGCIRNCSFCVVPEKEGSIRQVNLIENIIQHKAVRFLDNNFLALSNHKDLLQILIEKNIKCCFYQGLDIRLVTESNSKLLANLNYFGEYVFAFDQWDYLPFVERGLENLDWRKDWQLKFFVYADAQTPVSFIIKRLIYLKEKKCLPYLMRDLNCWDSKNYQFYIDLARWVNQPNLFKKMTFKEFLQKSYISKKEKDKNRIRLHLNLYNC